ncbi:MAG TPA: tannase/feruloyl esterase family alpha/beta hydrolase [Terracidiphilus sp.]|nr:tannase/feruloyl esterase family alpha/beta hydrolase [Terracidiphilus sp.]
MYRLIISSLGLLIVATSILQAQALKCASLKAQRFATTHIHSAESVAAGPFNIPQEGPVPASSEAVPAFCRVRGEVAPHIGFELWMPAKGWNGRLVSVGSGGFGGAIDFRALAKRLRQGYSGTANDTGHEGQGYEWMHDPAARRAWGHSATHDVTGPVKEIVRAFYRRAPAYSYFVGCSTGGAQAMEEAEFFPGDFNGIVAGSPGMYYSHLMLSFLWGLKVATENAPLSQQKLQFLNRAVMNQCDQEDGVKDGVLENPLACHFNPATLLCKEPNTKDCLTHEEVKTAELMYRGPRNPRAGMEIYPGFVPGSEASPEFTGAISWAYGWTLIQGPLATQYAIPLLKNMVFGNKWDWKTFDFDHDVQRVDRRLHSDIDSTDPDLRGFRARGGKLIMIQGWGDPFNAQTFPIEYYKQVVRLFAANEGERRAERTVNGFFRLFMAPGMGHCAGGPGPSEANDLDTLRAWVEKGKAPDLLVARKITLPTGKPARPAMTRPLCPYPEVARWTKKGSTNDGNNFICTSQ